MRMRTTIELPEEQRNELLRLAQQQGQNDFSAIVQKAVAMYLVQNRAYESAKKEALKLKGSFSGKEAYDFEEIVMEVRENWR